MSRHRAVRGNWKEEIEDDGYEWEISLVLKAVPGADVDWIVETLDYYNGDTDATIEYLQNEIGSTVNGKNRDDLKWENDVLIVDCERHTLTPSLVQTVSVTSSPHIMPKTKDRMTKKIDLRELAGTATGTRKFGDLLSKSCLKSSFSLKSNTASLLKKTGNDVKTNLKVKKEKEKSATKTVPVKVVKEIKKVKEQVNCVVDQINSDMLALGLVSNVPKVSQVSSNKKRVKLDLQQEKDKRSKEKAILNIVVIGHVDSGKSTLMGHLLFKLGKVSDRVLKKFEKDAQILRKGSFVFAWVLDETDQERSRGVTVDVAMNEFETDHRKFTLLDAPGHKDFIPNMINGATQADVALLVIDASSGGFESGFHLGGQTREHTILVKSLGVSQLIVAINKMDMTGWSQSRFDHIRDVLLQFLKQIGFKKDQIFFVPVSGFKGDNIIEPSENLVDWYSGKTLLEYLDNLMVPKRDISKPFRMPINDVFKGGMGGGILVDGRIESGSIQIGDSVCVRPVNEIGVVKAIGLGEADYAEWAMAGDHVNITLSGIDAEKLSSGNMLCDPASLVPVSSLISIQALTLDLSVPLTLGFPLILHHQQRAEPAIISKLVAIHDKSTGHILKSNPRVIGSQILCSIQVKLIDRPICVETYETIRELGRVTLRSGSETVAVGKVLSIDDAQNL